MPSTEPHTDPVMVGELTEEFFGWYIKVADIDPVLGWRHVDLVGLRTWEYQGKRMVGLIVKDDGPCGRLELHYSDNTPCVLIKPITSKAKRAAKERAHAEH
ncbi:MAG: hypothetical protein JWO62_2610 [Acidimicrobiaceae bacterium]|nr:hypothetical protein [Acidimicrobiaceae bacterium]